MGLRLSLSKNHLKHRNSLTRPLFADIMSSWISQRRWKLLLIQFSASGDQTWAGISPITRDWSIRAAPAPGSLCSLRLLLTCYCEKIFIWLSVCPIWRAKAVVLLIIRVFLCCLIGIGCLSTPNKTSTNFFPFVTSALISLCFVAASIRFFTEKMS